MDQILKMGQILKGIKREIKVEKVFKKFILREL